MEYTSIAAASASIVVAYSVACSVACPASAPVDFPSASVLEAASPCLEPGFVAVARVFAAFAAVAAVTAVDSCLAFLASAFAAGPCSSEEAVHSEGSVAFLLLADFEFWRYPPSWICTFGRIDSFQTVSYIERRRTEDSIAYPVRRILKCLLFELDCDLDGIVDAHLIFDESYLRKAVNGQT